MVGARKKIIMVAAAAVATISSPAAAAARMAIIIIPVAAVVAVVIATHLKASRGPVPSAHTLISRPSTPARCAASARVLRLPSPDLLRRRRARGSRSSKGPSRTTRYHPLPPAALVAAAGGRW